MSKKRNQARDAHRAQNALGLLPNGAPIRLSVRTPGIKWVTCTCGCERQYPFAWVEELLPFVTQLVREGKGRVIPTLTSAGYVVADEAPGGAAYLATSVEEGMWLLPEIVARCSLGPLAAGRRRTWTPSQI